MAFVNKLLLRRAEEGTEQAADLRAFDTEPKLFHALFLSPHYFLYHTIFLYFKKVQFTFLESLNNP